MTWLELIDELKKQPLYLLERDVAVWIDLRDKNYNQLDWLTKTAWELTSPYNDFSFDEWLRDHSHYLSLCIELGANDIERVAKLVKE